MTSLIQIEEPSARDPLEESGLAMGLDLGTDVLKVAISVGGNLAVVTSPGLNGFLPARLARDAEGRFLGLPENATPSSNDIPLGRDDLVRSAEEERAAETFAEHLRALLRLARLELGQRTRRPVTAAVAVVPTHFDRAARLLWMSAIEGAGLDILNLLDEPVAVALALGLDRQDGRYGWISPDGTEAAVVEAAEGRLSLKAAIRPDSLAEAANFLREWGIERPMEVPEPATAAVIGAALLAEELGR